MPVKTKVDLGLHYFEARIASQRVGPSSSSWPTGTANVVRVLGAPGGVLYAPYSVDQWRKKIATGQDATTTLIGTKSADGTGRKREQKRLTQFRFANQILYDTFGGNTWHMSSGTGSLLALAGSVPTSAPDTRTKALVLAAEGFIADYYDKKSSIRGASSLAEMASTVRGLASPAKALRKEVDNLYNSLRKRAYRSDGTAVKDAGKVIGGTWLEWQFGIKPLASDANVAAEAVNKLSQGDFRSVVPIRGSGSDAIQTPDSQGPFAVPAKVNGVAIANVFGYRRFITEDTFCVVRGGVRVAPDGGEVSPVMQFGLGFEDIAPAVWEAIPWSFFLDYFFNVSSVIDSWGNLGSRLTWCNRTIRNSRTFVFSDVFPLTKSGTGIQNSDQYSAYGGHGKLSYTSTTRAPLHPDDIAPPLRIKLPGFGTKWANMAALATMFRPPGRRRNVGDRFFRY